MKKMNTVTILVNFGLNILKSIRIFLIHIGNIILRWEKKTLKKIKACFQRKLTWFKVQKKVRSLNSSMSKMTKAVFTATASLDQLAKSFDNIREEQESKQIIAVDFDGTLCEDCWPQIGTMNHELILWLIWRQKHGSSIILWTCRENQSLVDAIDACSELGLIFDAVNESLEETVQRYSGRTRKVYADVYIDDHNSTNYWKLPFHPANNK